MSNSGSTLIDAVNAAYPAMAQFYASDWYVMQSRNEGWYVLTGCVITASGTAGKFDMSAGTIFIGTTELNVAAVTASSTTVTSLADATNPKWVALEIDTSGVLNFNAGTAAANPEKPTPTGSRVVVAWVYVPATATAVDALTSSANGKAKIIEARQLVTTRWARPFAVDTTRTVLTNPTTATTLLASAPSVPANSLNTGDRFRIAAGGRIVNNASNSTVVLTLSLGSGAFLASYTTASLTTSASARRFSLLVDVEIAAIGSGSSGAFVTSGYLFLSQAGSTSPAAWTSGGGTGGDGGIIAAPATFDTTIANTIDLKTNFGTSSSGATITLATFVIEKMPGV